MSPEHRSHRAELAGVLATLLFVAYLVALNGGWIKFRLEWPEYTILGFLVLLSSGIVGRLAEISFGKDGVQVRLTKLENLTDRNRRWIDAMQILYGTLIDKYQREHLSRMSKDGPCLCHYGEIFFEQIKDLDARDLLRPVSTRGFNAIREDHGGRPQDEFDLKDYMSISPSGRRYLRAVNWLASEGEDPAEPAVMDEAPSGNRSTG